MNTTDSTALSQAVMSRVARAEGIPPAELDPPLYEVIDPEALNDLFASPPDGPVRTRGKVVFEYLTYEVTVTADGAITLRPTSTQTEEDQPTVARITCSCDEILTIPSPADIRRPWGTKDVACDCGATYSVTVTQLKSPDDK